MAKLVNMLQAETKNMTTVEKQKFKKELKRSLPDYIKEVAQKAKQKDGDT